MAKRVIPGLGAVAAVMATTMLVGVTPSSAATPPINLKFSLQPEKLGGSTTVSIEFEIPHSSNQMLSAMSEFNVLLPAEMGLGGSTLGIDTCSTQTLSTKGPSGCPTDALMGGGSAVAEASLGVQIVNEAAPITAFMTQATNGHTTLLYYFSGKIPVIAPLVFPSEFLAAGNSPRSEFQLALPPITGLPETPNAAIFKMNVNLGPKDISYIKHVGGKLVHYKPIGLQVPNSCPTGGFPFSAHFAFEDGSQENLVRKVPCPRPHH